MIYSNNNNHHANLQMPRKALELVRDVGEGSCHRGTGGVASDLVTGWVSQSLKGQRLYE